MKINEPPIYTAHILGFLVRIVLSLYSHCLRYYSHCLLIVYVVFSQV